MERDLIEKIKNFVKKLGDVRTIFTDKNGNYAVAFKGSSETLAVFDDNFDMIEFCSFYDKEGGNISAHWDITYQDEPFDEEDEEINVNED